jgi:UDP-glucose 4-epimerase
MRYLITGGAGFVGSLAGELARGGRVHVLDDLTTGSIDSIAHLKRKPGFNYSGPQAFATLHDTPAGRIDA